MRVPTALFFKNVLGAVLLWTFWTNQFHKWAHVQRPPALIGVLQRLRVILPPRHHARHHQEPFTTHYCITTGWLNRPLAAIGFFSHLERVLSKIGGFEARVSGSDSF